MAPSGESSDGCERLRRAAEDGGPVPAFPLKSFPSIVPFLLFSISVDRNDCGVREGSCDCGQG